MLDNSFYSTYNKYYNKCGRECKEEMQKNDLTMVRKRNRILIKKCLMDGKAGTKHDLAVETGLSVATCNTLLNEMSKSGEITELEYVKSSGGRPSKEYCLNMDYRHVLWICLISSRNRKETVYGAADLAGTILWKKQERMDKINLEKILEIIEQALCGDEKIGVVSVGIPGVFAQGRIEICDLPELVGVRLEEVLEKRFHLAVIIENDMNAAAYGYYRSKHVKDDGAESLAVVSCYEDMYPGCGLIVDGKIIRGNSNFAGELSYLPFGENREALNDNLKKEEEQIRIVGHMAASLSAIVNPSAIFLMEGVIRREWVEGIVQECRKYIPQEHMPQIKATDQIEEYYRFGMLCLGREKLDKDEGEGA